MCKSTKNFACARACNGCIPYRRGSDVKKLRKAALEVLGPTVSDDDLNAILPSKADVQMVKMSNKAIVFTVKDQPLFFDPNGRGRVFPTVYTMWAFPAAFKSLLTFSEVSPKVLGGADLMLPGVIVPPEGMPDFAADEMMALRIPDNPYPFAVGEMEVDRSTVVTVCPKASSAEMVDRSSPTPSAS